MKTASISYGKMVSSVTELNGNGIVKTMPVSKLELHLSELDGFSIKLGKTVLKKTVKMVEGLGFSVTIDESFGFDWEVKLTATK